MNGWLHMHGAHRQLFTDIRMAFSAGLLEILFVDRRFGVIRRQNIMRPVTAGAISNDGSAKFTGQAVIAFHICLQAVSGQTVLRRDLLGRMALPADFLGNSGRVDFRVGIQACQNIVLAVAIGANRRFPLSCARGLAVHTALISLENVLMAFAASRLDIASVNL